MKSLMVILPFLLILNASGQEDCSISEWDGIEKITEFVQKMHNKRRPQGPLTDSEKVFWQWKDEFKSKSKELLLLMRGLECSSRKDENSKTKLPSDDPQVIRRFQELKQLNEKIKNLLVTSTKIEEKGKSKILKPLLHLTDPNKKRIYEDQVALVDIDWDFFEDNYKWINSVANSNNFLKNNPDISKAFEVWMKTDNQESFEKLSKTFKGIYNAKFTPDPHGGILYGLMQAYSGDPIYKNGPKLSMDQNDKELLRRIGTDGLRIGDQFVSYYLPAYVDWLEVSDNEKPLYFRAGLISSLSSDDRGRPKTIFNSKKVTVPDRLRSHLDYKNKQFITEAEALFADKGIKNWNILKRNGFFQDMIGEYEYIDVCNNQN